MDARERSSAIKTEELSCRRSGQLVIWQSAIYNDLPEDKQQY
jgi:hypothetical protein